MKISRIKHSAKEPKFNAFALSHDEQKQIKGGIVVNDDQAV